ncbi:glycosyltransferase family 4 protein [Micromonospora sp. HNM0581]|uniref:glycosyltransferase n=1 Tax=Micromonospora sp. HNM0581 TaxID=2716341 RepID=UPI00146CD6C9|nr:glycosyltransferase family 4 protein [Micromonospora sp. HNM0581]
MYLVPVPTPLHRERHELRRSLLRWPLAYPKTKTASDRAQRLAAWRADVRVRRIALRSGSHGTGAGIVERFRLAASVLGIGLTERVVGLRSRQTKAAQQGRRVLDGRLDRIHAYVWRTVRGDRCWRRLEPLLWDYELAFAEPLDRLEPELIHANDFRMLGVGARAALRARGEGRVVKLVWEAREYLPGLKPRSADAHWRLANMAHEREYSRYADAVITVSDTLADLLKRRHRLSRQPYVLLNAPELSQPADADGGAASDVRQQCGLAPEVPLLVYSGAVAEQRGIATMIKGLVAMSDVHLALVVLDPSAAYLTAQLSRAAAMGVRERIHVLPYVPHWQVVSFLTSADVGVIPIHRWLNHEISLITKFFEYSHARLPLVVSDVRTMAEATRRSGQGEVFRAKDVDDYVRAVRAVLADPHRYRAAYETPGMLDEWTWRSQASVLDRVYRELVPGPTGPSLRKESVDETAETRWSAQAAS